MAAGDDLDVLAGEYVLGTLGVEEREAVERRLLDSPELAARVAAWERRLAPLSDDLAPVTPRPEVWLRVRRGIQARRLEPAARPVPRWSRPGFWRDWAAAATAAAMGLLLLILTYQQPTSQLVAVLSDPSGRPLWVLRASPEDSRLQARPIDGAGGPGQVPQLWLAQGDRPPVSLGLLERGGPDRQILTPPPGIELRPGDTVAISLEPPGGSPTGQPTGPVISHGVLLAEPL
jgi:anti-sigma-K factor RskA